MFKILSGIFKIISLLFIAFLVWFGFTFYKQFSALEEDGVTRISAAEQAFIFTADIAKDMFSAFYNKGASLLNYKLKEEDARELFIESRGIPEVYFVTISYDVLRDDGTVQKRTTPLYLEIWFYGEPYNKKVVFENGYFIKESDIKDTSEFVKNPLSPLDVKVSLTKNKLTSIMGEPTCTLESEEEKNTLTTYRFKEDSNRPLLSATFAGDKLIFLSSGFVFLTEQEKSLCK